MHYYYFSSWSSSPSIPAIYVSLASTRIPSSYRLPFYHHHCYTRTPVFRYAARNRSMMGLVAMKFVVVFW